jgi:hypothetical protein
MLSSMYIGKSICLALLDMGILNGKRSSIGIYFPFGDGNHWSFSCFFSGLFSGLLQIGPRRMVPNNSSLWAVLASTRQVLSPHMWKGYGSTLVHNTHLLSVSCVMWDACIQACVGMESVDMFMHASMHYLCSCMCIYVSCDMWHEGHSSEWKWKKANVVLLSSLWGLTKIAMKNIWKLFWLLFRENIRVLTRFKINKNDMIY